jgi:membrane protease YdiL (CAAX protease family)
VLADVPYDSPTAVVILVVFGAAVLIGMVLPILLLRAKLDEIPAIGDIKALLPRNRGELPYGTGLALTAGVVEELLFRLALPAAVFGVTGSGPVAFGVAAVIFGVLHIYQGPQGMFFAFLLGLVFTALYVLSGSIVVPIVLHALIDLRSLVLIPVVLGGAGKPVAGTPVEPAPTPR